MIDFRKKDLYKREQTRMETFLMHKLVTAEEVLEEEREAQMNMGMADELEAGDFLGGDSFDVGGIDDEFGLGNDGTMGDFGGAGDRSGVKDDESWNIPGQPIKTFLFAPGFLVKYVFIDITKDMPKKEEWKGIVKAFNVGNMISIGTALLELAIGINNIFSPVFQLSAGMFMFMITTAILYFVYNEDTYAVQTIKKVFGTKETEKDLEDLNFSDDDSFGDLDLDLDMDLDDDKEDAETDETVLPVALEQDESLYNEDDEYEEIDEDVDYDDERLRDSPLDPSNDDIFKQELLEVFARGNINRGKEYGDRVEILESFSDYLIQNDKKFGSMVRPKERGIEYNNIAYSLYKGLSQIERQFSKYEEGEIDRLVVLDIKKSPILYRIEVELPNYFSERKIQHGIKIIEDALKVAEDDFDVAVLVTTFQGNYVFKLLRFDSKVTTSVGDILRYKDEDRGYIGLEPFRNPKYGLPILFGLQNNEVPYVVDWEENTSGVIVGGSGSGKSWATFMMMTNFVMANDYNNVQFIVLDKKNSPFWNSFARFPHVLGYHTDVNDYIDVLMEIEEERQRRQEQMVELGIENIKGYREKLRKEGRYEELKQVPLLFVIVDEITATLLDMKEKDEELFKAASNIMGQIATQGRSSGVRILGIGQRSTFDSIPKTLMANCSFKFGMRMNVENDFVTMFGKDVERLKYPRQKGLGLSVTEETMGIQNVKTLTVGGNSDDQILMLIRAMAFEWVRRGHENEDFMVPPKGVNIKHSFNRNRFYQMSISEMREGKILTPAEVNEGYEVILDGKEEEKEPGYKIQKEMDRLNRNKIVEDNIEKENKNESVFGKYRPEKDIPQEEDEEKWDEYNDYDEEETNNLTGYEDENISVDGEIQDTEDEQENESWMSLLNNQQEDMENENKAEIINNNKREEIDLHGFESTETEIDAEINEIKFNDVLEEGNNEGTENERRLEMEHNNNLEDIEFKNGTEVETERQEEQSVLSLEEILNPREEHREESSDVLRNDGRSFVEEQSEQPSEHGDIYSEITEKSTEKQGIDVEDTNAAKDHLDLHSKDHQELPMRSHTILQENFTVIEKDIVETNEGTEIEENNNVESTSKDTELQTEKEKEISRQLQELEMERKRIEQERKELESLKQFKQREETNEEKIENEKEVEITTDDRKEEKDKKLEDLTRIERVEDEREKRVVEVDFVTEEVKKVEEPPMSVKQYVAQFGEARGFNVFMSKEELESVYNKTTINKALSRMAIIEKDDNYMTDL